MPDESEEGRVERRKEEEEEGVEESESWWATGEAGEEGGEEVQGWRSREEWVPGGEVAAAVRLGLRDME